MQVVSNQGFGALELFEPLGLRNSTELFQKHLPSTGFKEVEVNEFPVQQSDSKTCGQFCIFYICQRYYNCKYHCFESKTINIHSYWTFLCFLSADMDFQYFLQEFFDPEDLKQNEKNVEEFMESI